MISGLEGVVFAILFLHYFWVSYSLGSSSYIPKFYHGTRSSWKPRLSPFCRASFSCFFKNEKTPLKLECITCIMLYQVYLSPRTSLQPFLFQLDLPVPTNPAHVFGVPNEGVWGWVSATNFWLPAPRSARLKKNSNNVIHNFTQNSNMID